MYAVIRTSGKQYRVAKDDRLVLDCHLGRPGAMVAFDQVLMIGDEGREPTLGAPLVDKAAVFAEVLEHTRADKIIVFKKKRRANYRRKKGHRQDRTVLRIIEVSPSGTRPEFPPKAVAAKGPEAAAAGEAKPADKE
jgi:large subunit ribosomal protein L21